MLNVPDKFKNPETGELNVDDLLNSYLAIEKKIGSMISLPDDENNPEQKEKFLKAIGVPDDYNEYPDNPVFEMSDDLKKKFREIGLNKNQVQELYQIANQFLEPVLQDVVNAKSELDEFNKLEKFFGSKEKMFDNLSAIQTWAEKYLPNDVLENLSCSSDGIEVLFNMMKSNEPALNINESKPDILSENELRDMMKSPKYWRDHNPEYVKKIEDGFKKLFS